MILREGLRIESKPLNSPTIPSALILEPISSPNISRLPKNCKVTPPLSSHISTTTNGDEPAGADLIELTLH